MFFDSRDRSRARRRGVVLILILGMLSLMALIGVTFATFAGQSLVNSRNFAAGVNWPGSEQLMDYALSQLINDTNNPLSAIRGHSLLRDMYGNDSVMGRRFDAPGATGSASSTGGLITSLPGIGALTLSNPSLISSTPTTKPYNLTGLIQYTTNIPNAFANPSYFGLDFTRWIVRIPGTGGGSAPIGGTVTATYEVVDDDYSAAGGTHLFVLAPIDPFDSFGQATRVYNNPQTPNIQAVNGPPTSGFVAPVLPPLNNATTVPFVLDGRYMRAFNGPGMSVFNFVGFDPTGTLFDGANNPQNSAAYGNFLYNGGLLHIPFLANWNPQNLPTVPGPAFGDPNLVGMDEDYDACDLENWFLALQSADGSVMIPSFHRPGILTAADWTNHLTLPAAHQAAATLMSKAKILRPRAIDNYQPTFPPDPSVPDKNGRLTYDIDNDGDGVTDSVWLDLGYPSLRDPRGLTFKPLFAFMVIGLNGRLPLNTAGNLQSRDFQRVTGNPAAAPAPNPYDLPTTFPGNTTTFQLDAAPQNFIDGATWSHASHLGYSVNEINPMFALQNAPNLVYGAGTYGVTSNFTQFDGFTTDNPAGNIGNAPNPMGDTNIATNAGVGNQYNSRILGNPPYFYQSATVVAPRTANPGVGVDIIQHRNLLAGTIPQDNITTPTVGLNGEQNFFMVGGTQWFVPDGMLDFGEGTIVTRRGVAAVPGRWGEPNGIPTVLDNNGGTTNPFPVAKQLPLAAPVLTSIYPIYTNPVRAGKSAVNWVQAPYLPLGVGDAGDDDFDSFDFFPISGTLVSGAEGLTAYNTPLPPNYVTASTGDFYDGTSGLVLPVERIRRFYNPIDAMGVGSVRGWTDKPPVNMYDGGNGYDNYGRVMFFRYFRPAGMPKTVTYATSSLANGYTLANTTLMSAQLQEQQVLNQPIMAGPQLNPTAAAPIYDTTTNVWHGYQSALAPLGGIAGGSVANTNADARVAVASAMPYDLYYDPAQNAYVTPTGYAYAASATAPLYPTIDGVNSTATMTSSVNSGQGPVLVAPDTVNNNVQTYNNPPTLPPGTILNPYAVNSTTNIASVVNGYPTYPSFRDVVTGTTTTQVVVPSASLNKDEADEMNLYSPNAFDMPYGPADLEWLYRQHDVDGAQLSSRLGSLAPISFLNPQDGLTRRRMFSVDTAETINGAYAPDNPLPVAYDYVTSFNLNGLNPNLGNVFTDPNFALNSRFISPYYNVGAAFPSPNATFSGIAFNPNPSTLVSPPYQNPNAVGLYPNPLSYPPSSGQITQNANLTYSPVAGANGTFQIAPNLVSSTGSRDRKINLNYPLPVSNDPAEPVRQKWIREAYQYFKTILPPQAIDTPQELAQLSQYCVNIVDFRDPDCSHTRFVNTDLMVIPATATSHSQLIFATLPVPTSAGNQFVHFPFDPSIYDEQVRLYQPKPGQTLSTANAVGLQTDWRAQMQYTPAGPPAVTAEFLVQHGMEYNPLALNEVLAYAYPLKTNGPFCRLAVEVLNTLTDDGTVPGGAGPTTNSSSDLPQGVLDGYDFVLMNDGYGYGRPDPITGELPLPGLVATANAYPNAATTPTYQGIISNLPVGNVNRPANPINFYSAHVNGMRVGGPQSSARGAYYQFGWNTFVAFGTAAPATPFTAWNPPITQEQFENPLGTPSTNPPTGFPAPDASFPTNFVMPITPIQGVGANPWPTTDVITYPAAGGPSPNATLWCWLYLRRPANPFDTRPYQYREMVTVDAIRFPFTYGNGTGQTVVGPPSKDQATQNSAQIFSVQRLQPYRGGHLVPPLPNANANNPSPGTCWGYSEQTANGYNTGVNGQLLQVYWGTSQQQTVGNANRYLIPQTVGIQHTFAPDGTPTAPNDGRNVRLDGAPTPLTAAASTPQWDYFPFNDRDFTGVAELLLVPGCPPGLFTKQFVENNNPLDTNTTGTTTGALQPPSGFASKAPVTVLQASIADASPFTQNTPRSYPYLVDKFYYSAASVLPQVTTNPATAYPNLVGTWTGDGWYKIFEFVEVPSSANGAIGTVAAGDNFDWFRQDTKPGLLNLNLIIDEEVFFGLMDDLRLNDSLNTTFTPPAVAFEATSPLDRHPDRPVRLPRRLPDRAEQRLPPDLGRPDPQPDGAGQQRFRADRPRLHLLLHGRRCQRQPHQHREPRDQGRLQRLPQAPLRRLGLPLRLGIGHDGLGADAGL